MLPHGTGRESRVAVFAEGDKAREAEEAGADVVGSADLAKRVEEGFTDFDVAIATPDQMGNVGRLGRVLGPRGLMPNPKTGTVTMDVGKAVREAKAGKLEYRTDRGANVHIPIGKRSFDERQLRRELRGARRRDRAREAGGRQGPVHQEDHARQHDGPRYPRRPVPDAGHARRARAGRRPSRRPQPRADRPSTQVHAGDRWQPYGAEAHPRRARTLEPPSRCSRLVVRRADSLQEGGVGCRRMRRNESSPS